MDESKYLELRDRLLRQAELDEKHQGLIRKFVFAVAEQISQEHGREKQTCTAGMLKNGQFVKDEFTSFGSSAVFALQIQFHAQNGGEIFKHAVEFRTKASGSKLKVERVGAIPAEVELTFDEAGTAAGQLLVAKMMDGPVEDAVDRVILRSRGAQI